MFLVTAPQGRRGPVFRKFRGALARAAALGGFLGFPAVSSFSVGLFLFLCPGVLDPGLAQEAGTPFRAVGR